MFDLWRRFAAIIFLIVVTVIIWGVVDAVTALALFSLVLLGLTIYHTYYLASLDLWFQRFNHSAFDPSTIPNVPKSFGVWGDVFIRLARFIRRYYRSRQSLSKALERLQRATSAMPEGIVILDEADRIEWCNPSAEQHLGLDLRLDIGQHVTHLVRQVQFVAYLTSGDYSKPLIIKQSRYEELVLLLQLVPYGDREKLLISRDITRFEKMEIMRRDFIANVSHELRTPLTVIGGFLETLLDEEIKDSEMEKRALILMNDQAKRMQHLVEDLLTLSKLENAQNILHEEEINIAELLQSLYQEAQSLSAGRHHIHLNLVSDAHLLGSVDELRSAFSNLISNAVRYTPDGGNISLSWTEEQGQGLFYVQDSGIGIGPEHIPRLAERFYRVDRSRSRETGGTGLGLAIVKHVLNRHQARMEIISEIEKGSIFKVWFPAKRLIKNKGSHLTIHDTHAMPSNKTIPPLI
ncbi:phosphate regulon sensor histidine kinase PhoR [Nitrosomonas communis]|uniref:Phosphate regulon sensor protein PhoR n=1 Tax=Nitrosomonas communis TaxID=44574 RepID=A0A1H2QGG5_9PROT|nr:phosphate regulon sensor histidine kinase PhoR [Nitrosomonas communis]SDW06256.1 two-component system, OmpR family, phosphate regulon sensor histidine kinase PhoR [Nitrosomonas communis]